MLRLPNHAHQHQIVSRGLADRDAPALNGLGKARHGELEFVLHLGPARSGSVPGAKVSSMRAEPDESLVAERYSIWSRPVIFCSMIWVTLFPRSLPRPGIRGHNIDRGGAIGGYCDMGKLYMARPPASMMMMAMTHAKTGRSRKKFR